MIPDTVVLIHEADRRGNEWWTAYALCGAVCLSEIRVHSNNKRVVAREFRYRRGLVIPLRRVKWCEKPGLSYGKFITGPSANTSPFI